MNNSPKRLHLEDSRVANYIRQHFVAIAALLIATNAKDLECDVEVDGRQFHIEACEVARNKQPERNN